MPRRVLPEDLTHATVLKHREAQRVVAVDQRLIFGTPSTLAAALERSEVSAGVNTSFLERRNRADRGRNARQVRKTYRFSKDWGVHEALTYQTMYGSNFCRAVRTRCVKDERGR